MTGAAVIVVLAAFAALCFGLALLGWVTDRLRIAARWRLWYYKTFKQGGKASNAYDKR